jgi:hypothetical protein
MQAIAEKNPHSGSELAEIMRESPWRLAHYGEDILKALRTPLAKKIPKEQAE